MDKYNIPRGLIEIEITESVVFANMNEVFSIMREFKENGFNISMDDFGSGYSSLGVLREIPIDTLKMDKIFLDHIEDSNAQIIAHNVINLAKSLNLNVGRYDISVKKDNYRDWIKNIEIKKEKSTPIFVWLIKETFEEKELFSKDEEFIKSWISRYQDSIIFLTKVINPEGSEFTYTYNLWSYNTNPAFWDFSNNPFVLTSFQGNDDFAIELDLSTNGKLAILTYNSESYLLDTSKNVLVTDLRKLNINGFDNYTRNWSKDNNYLILESDADIISYDLQRDTKYLLLKKNDSEKYIYSTDTLGFFYLIKEDQENKRDNIYTYDLTQRKLDGSNISLILDNMYFQKNENYIKSYREDRESKNVFICEPFTNSPECTQSIGSVQSIDINHDTKGIFIKTDLATYWYNIEDSKYLMVSAYPADLIA